VIIAMGTEIVGTDPDRPNSWGQNGAEPDYLVKPGITPLEAIEAATATAPLALGPLAPRSGLLAECFDAELITVDGDPLADSGVLADPGRSTGAWTGGRRVRAYRPCGQTLTLGHSFSTRDIGGSDMRYWRIRMSVKSVRPAGIIFPVRVGDQLYFPRPSPRGIGTRSWLPLITRAGQPVVR
jgi:hypothetical protein